MKIEEYVPIAIPTNSASARSFSVPGAEQGERRRTRIAATGSRATTEVLIDRTSVWLTARFAASRVGTSAAFATASLVFSRTLSNTTTVS